MDDLELARNYIFRKMHHIRGYLVPVDALAIAEVIIGQKNARMNGGIAEIGVFFGRSFLLMASLIGKQERALAADLFDIGQDSGGKDSLQLASFLSSANKLGIQIDRQAIFVGDSRKLDGSSELQQASPLRFVSIDGSHELDLVASDADLASRTITEFGVICFDDFCNPEFPEVTLGVFDFLRSAHERFVPFAITQKKLFVCKREYHDFYSSLVAHSELLRRIERKSISMNGVPVLLLRQSFMERARYEVLARSGFGGLNNLFY